MHTHSELVRSVLRWAMTILAGDARSSRIPLPRLSQITLGRMMSRSDPQTCAAIAREIAQLEHRECSDEYLSDLVSRIRAGWGEVASSSPRRGGREVLQERAELVMNVVSRFGTRRDREILETCVMLRSWRQSETIWPGRSWQSVQDDFRSIADRLYQKEHRMLMETSELIAEVARRAAEQQSRRRA